MWDFCSERQRWLPSSTNCPSSRKSAAGRPRGTILAFRVKYRQWSPIDRQRLMWTVNRLSVSPAWKPRCWPTPAGRGRRHPRGRQPCRRPHSGDASCRSSMFWTTCCSVPFGVASVAQTVDVENGFRKSLKCFLRHVVTAVLQSPVKAFPRYFARTSPAARRSWNRRGITRQPNGASLERMNISVIEDM